MKYIRTKDGIIKLEYVYYYANDIHRYLIVPNGSPVRKDKIKNYFEKHKILNITNTIEELCDEFVIEFENKKELSEFRSFNNGMPQYMFTQKGCEYRHLTKAPQSWCYVEVE